MQYVLLALAIITHLIPLGICVYGAVKSLELMTASAGTRKEKENG